VRVVGVVGEDEAGQMLLREMAALGADATQVRKCRDRPTTQKTRIIAQHQQMLRVDREGVTKVEDALAAEILECVRGHLSECDAVILSDYDKGVVCPRLVPAAIEAAREDGVLVTADPKPANMALLSGCNVVCPNEHEAAFAVAMPITDDQSLQAAAYALLDRFRTEAVLITRGPKGMSLFAADGEEQYVPAAAEEVYDVTGAGDTVIATFTMALAAGATRREAMELATIAAGNVVRKLGAATTTAEEILQALEEHGG
jgi:rfaE bifunctional protein kinase chain/domain